MEWDGRATAAEESPPHRKGASPTACGGLFSVKGRVDERQRYLRRAIRAALTTRARLLRFLCVGGLVTLVQLGLLFLLAALALPSLLANALALLLAAQLNFALNSAFTWADRPALKGGFPRRWLRFMASVGGILLLNQGVFALARLALPTILASALGSGLTSSLNFVLGDRFVFLG